MGDGQVSLKLLIDTKGDKVLFAEADKKFVDFLFNILTIPVGTVTRIVPTKDMVGSLGNLYESVMNLSNTFMQPNLNRESLFNPIPHFSIDTPLLLPTIASLSPIASTAFYGCNSSPDYYGGNSKCRGYVSKGSSAACPSCSNWMSSKLVLVNPPADDVGFVKGVVTYMVMDDLVVTPMSTISGITLLNKFNIQNVGSLQERVINIGIKEGVNLLKASLQTKQVLTDVFLKKKLNNEN